MTALSACWQLHRQRVLGSIALAVAYYAAVHTGYLFVVPPVDSAAVWPAAGVGVAALFLWGPGLWPGLWLAAFLAPVLRGGPILAAVLTATAKAGLAVWAASLLQRNLAPACLLTHARHLAALVGIAAGTSTVGAAIGTAVSLVHGRIAWAAAGANWLAWMVGDCAGILLVVPLTLAWIRHPRPAWSRHLWLELAGGCLAIGGAGAGAFGPWLPQWLAEHCALALVFGLAWTAARFDQRTVSTLTACIATAAVWGARAGHGAFAVGAPGASFVMLEVYIILLAVTGLLLAAISARRREAEAALRLAHDQMEAQVRERTASLMERTRQIEAIERVAGELTRELDLPNLLRLVYERVGGLLGGVSGAIHLWDETDQALVPYSWHDPGGWRQRLHLRLGEGVAGTAAMNREGLLVNEFRTSPYATPFHLEHTRHTAVLAEPLLYRDRLLGVIAVENEMTQRPFTEEDRQLLRLFAAHAAIAIENARLYASQREAYDRLQQAQGELVRSEKLRVLGQMSAGIAHDLNNMLSAILGQIDLLRLRRQASGLDEALETLETAAADGAQVVRRIQDFARPRSGSPLEAVNLATVVSEALEITRPRWHDDAQRRGIRIRVETDIAESVLVESHAPELREVLTNLIFNAVDAMPQGGTLTLGARVTDGQSGDEARGQLGEGTPALPRRRVAESPSRLPGGCVELRIGDTGTGMPPEVQAKIFEPFFTTKGVLGTGLGLSVVFGIVQRHGGTIEVASTSGTGTVFTLRLRRAGSAPPARTAGRQQAIVPRRLLLIEDETDVRKTMGKLLETVGHRVFEAEDGAAGLALLGVEAVDAVLTDLGMPGLTGWDVARTVKARFPALPVVLMTGWGQNVQPDTTGGAVVDRILGKPVQLKELLDAIQGLTAASERNTGSGT
jgi:signal transduction histidine kinase/integral membrane sensor domain MASE1/ActR/RegA family two-component response regulator